ncbi:MAG: hypothetical protein QW476_03000 [Candidatus Bathyarchaeia archaeon]|nr:hypothetical protein [Candidatus Bathyarchaeota archaeon]
MVKEIKVFVCRECSLGYLDVNLAKRCEEHCLKYHACSLEVTKNAVYFPKA